MRRLLQGGGTLIAPRTGWKITGRDMTTVLSVFVFSTTESMTSIMGTLREMLVGVGWRHSMDLPEFGHMELTCSSKLIWTYFQAGELDPIEVTLPGHIIVVYY